MADLILKPEFFVDLDGQIKSGSIAVNRGRVINTGTVEGREADITIELKNQVVLPGFTNCHSHAFQRGLRGLVERHIENQGADHFFAWRKHMYKLAQCIDEEDLLVLAQLLYLEMIEAGFTHVGEFHYLHHSKNSVTNQDPLAMTRALAQAATATGINQSLLLAAYSRSDFNEPIRDAQRRFFYRSVDEFLEMCNRARREVTSDNTAVGLAIHSVRAVDDSFFGPINNFAAKNRMPLHIHVSEQVDDVRSCLKYTNLSPIKLLEQNHLLAPHTTLIHATHLIDGDLQAITEHRPIICICPSTEMNLGDGMAPLSDLLKEQVVICIGTDQHVRLNPMGEALSLEEQERLRLGKRCVFNENGSYLYQSLLPILTSSGLASLYPDSSFENILNSPANLIALELPPEYQWHGPEAAMDAMMLSNNTAKVTMVMSNGHILLQDGMLKNPNRKHLRDHVNRFFKNKFR